MAHADDEALVLFDVERPIDAARTLVEERADILQMLPPRIAIVRWPHDATALPSVPGSTWYLGELPLEVTSALTEAQRMFIDAWVSRGKPKLRSGDGLPWDAPGKQPPDWPEMPDGPDTSPSQ